MRVQRMRGYRVVGAGVAALLALSACGGGGDDDKPDTAAPGTGGTSNGTGDIRVQGCKPDPLIPSNTNTVCGGDILDNVLAKLIRYNADTGDSVNDIAESIETKDSKTFTIALKRGVKFTDGTEVKAKNFVDSWNFAAYAPNAQINSSWMEAIAGYEDVQGENPKAETLSGLKTVDDYSFTVTLNAKTATFPRQLGYTVFAALPDSFFKDKGKAFGAMPVGAGPFKIVSVDVNKEIVMEVDPAYDRGAKASVQKVTYAMYEDPDAAYKDLLAGNLDIANALPDANLASGQFLTELGDRKMEGAPAVFQSITFPAEKSGDKSYDNVKLRQALSMAIDRPLITKNIFFDTRVPATGWVAPVVDGYKEGACGQYCTFNPEQAKRLYQEAGGHQGPIEISYNADGPHKAWVDAVCNQFKENLGAECLPKPVPIFTEFRKTVVEKKIKGLFRTGWQMDYPSIENFLVPLYVSKASSNDGDYANKAFDQKVREAATKVDEAEINATFQAAEQMLAADMPAIPLWYSKTVSGHSEKISKAKFTVFGTYDFTSIVMK